MNDNWTDFEKYVFGKLEKLDHRLTKLETKWVLISAAAGTIGGILLQIGLAVAK